MWEAFGFGWCTAGLAKASVALVGGCTVENAVEAFGVEVGEIWFLRLPAGGSGDACEGSMQEVR